jgi:oligosaccharide repeat unit polymerase
MLLFFVIFIFFVFHILFLVKNIFFGVDEARFFMWVMKYPFSREVAVQSLWFVLACTVGFWLGYKLANLKGLRNSKEVSSLFESRKWRHQLRILNFMGAIIISYIVVLGGLTGFSYGPMTLLRESNGFIFELRMVYLLLLSHLLLNINWRSFLYRPELRLTRIILMLYLLALVLFQARSPIFELGVCIIIPLLMSAGDKVRIKYILLLCLLLIVPNIIVLGRIGIPEDNYELIDGLFSIEYSMIMVKFIGAAIDSSFVAETNLSFLPQISLIIPSPLRNMLGIEAINSDYINELSLLAEVSGGGFSMVAQMYTDFGWVSPLIFCLLGFFIGKINFKASNIGRVNLIYATAPLLYSMFILSFRNDFGVFLKYSIQLFIVASILNIALRVRLKVKSEN